MIEYECAQQSCGQRHSIYTKYSTDGTPEIVASLLLKANLTIACTEDHSVELDASRVNALRLEP
jgi:hypothetical protein